MLHLFITKAAAAGICSGHKLRHRSRAQISSHAACSSRRYYLYLYYVHDAHHPLLADKLPLLHCKAETYRENTTTLTLAQIKFVIFFIFLPSLSAEASVPSVIFIFSRRVALEMKLLKCLVGNCAKIEIELS